MTAPRSHRTSFTAILIAAVYLAAAPAGEAAPASHPGSPPRPTAHPQSSPSSTAPPRTAHPEALKASAKKQPTVENGDSSADEASTPSAHPTDEKQNTAKKLPDWLGSPAARKRPYRWQYDYRWWILGGVLFANAAITVLIGRSAWDWGENRGFKLQDDRWFEKSPDLDGGADKLGHLVGMYLMSRGMTYIFDETGMPHWVAVLAGGLNSAMVGTLIEVGDAYTAKYGFSYTDIVFNLIGTGFAMLQDSVPILDDLFSLSIWWFPSRGYLFSKDKKQEMFTDYTGTKHFLHLLLSGVPYVKETPLRYFRLDVAFWSRNFKPYDYGYPDNLQQFVYIGASVDFAQLVWDVFPKKWYRTSTYVFLKYFNIYGPFETGVKLEL
jgi:hypothetical protein